MAKITINLQPNTMKALKNYAFESNQLVDKVVQLAVESLLDPGYEKDYDDLYKEVVKISKSNKDVSLFTVQRKLGIGYARAERLLTKLNQRK